MTKLTHERVLSVLRTGSSAERVELVQSLPPNGFRDAAVGLVNSDNPGMVVVALGSLVHQYAYGRDPECGAVLASALHERAREISESVPDHGLIPTTLSGLASSHAKALSLLGRSDEVVEITTRYIPLYEQLDEQENLPSLRVLQIEALVNLGRIDEADAKLRQSKLESHAIAGIEARRLRGIVERLKANPTQVLSSDEPASSAPSADSLIDVLRTAVGLGFEGDAGAGLARQVDLLDASKRLDPSDPEQYQQLLDTLAQAEAFMTRGGEDSELAVRGKVRQASAIFVHGTPGPDAIESSLAQLAAGREWARHNKVADLESDALWGIYLCNSRLARSSDAADALISLRTNLESVRHGIAEPLARGGVFRAYPYLFNALCEQLQKAGRAQDLLEAIESSKGRVIADKLTEQTGDSVQDAATYDCVTRMPELTRAEQFHYLTYFVDDERVYAAFVSKQGRVYAVDPVEITRRTLPAAAVEPAKWGKPIASRPRHRLESASEVLAPIVSFLDELLERGVVERDDHICCSSDDDLQNIPLHYLRFRGELVLDWFSVSRVHSAFHLVSVLERAPRVPDAFVGFAVPLAQDRDRPTGEAMVAALDAPLEWLGRELRGSWTRHADATLDCVLDSTLDRRVVHFSTHGWFPMRAGNPFDDSYLVLSNEDGLPDLETIVGGDRRGALTPRTILEHDLDLEASHVSMMACVSGLAREGIAGDSLGLDWALIQAGAASLISTHWKVSAARAARFFERFYEKWIRDGRSRAAAIRETTLELLDSARDPSALQQWAAFSLTGDFR